MSNLCKRLAKGRKNVVRVVPTPTRPTPPKRYASFNIFTREGENLTVESDKPMTLNEAQYYFNALSISGND